MTSLSSREPETVGDILDELDEITARRGLGHNCPPPSTPFEAIQTDIMDLWDTAMPFLDGKAVASQADADWLGKLRDMALKAHKAADEARKVEKAPFDAGAAEVQARYYPLLVKTKQIQDACKTAAAPWLNALEDEQRAVKEAARIEAERLAEKARQDAIAARALEAPSLEAQAKADASLEAAEAAQKVSTKAERMKAQAKGGERAMGLRSVWRAELVNPKAALAHYCITRRADVLALLVEVASRDVRAGVREIPGFTVIEDRVPV